MKQHELAPNYIVKDVGNKAELENALENIVSATSAEVVDAKNVKIFVVLDDEEGKKVLFNVWQGNPVCGVGGDCYYLDDIVKASSLACISEERFDELKNTKIVFGVEKGGDTFLMPTDASLLSDLAGIGIKGSFAAEPSFALASAIKKCIDDTNRVMLVARTSDDNLKKVFALRSRGYMYVPQTELYKMTNDVFTDAELRSWEITNYLTFIRYEFPGETRSVNLLNSGSKTITPVIDFFTSDVGSSSIIWEVGFRVGDHVVYNLVPGGKLSHVHKGKFNASKEAELRNRLASLRDKFTTFGEKLEELDKVEFFGADAVEVVKNLLTDNKVLKTNIPDEVKRDIEEDAATVLNNPVNTAADVILYMMTIPDRLVGINNYILHAIKEAIGECMYMKMRGPVAIK